MTYEELLNHAKRLNEKFNTEPYNKLLPELKEFFYRYSGANNNFYESVKDYKIVMVENKIVKDMIHKVLLSFIDYLEAGLLNNTLPERQIEIDVVSGYLSQAQYLINDSSVHPAIPISIIGASLEQFLLNWIESKGLDSVIKKFSIDSYTQLLRKHNFITKQDQKDIISWAGLRNSAAHGKWDEVNKKKQAELMLESVNLFMRKYS